MSWTSHHRRGEILRDVVAAIDERRDGLLPMDLPGVADTFTDELDLLAALQLRWHTRLSGRIEAELAKQPMDLEDAVVGAWHAAADDLPGLRAVLDHYYERPADDAMAVALAKSQAKERVTLAVMAGRGAYADAECVRIGSMIEARARAEYVPSVRTPERKPFAGLVDMLRSVRLAA
ncbi:hypothetical protein J2S40_000636 [Nocardioides luteus]|uniref:DUF222 domain-containing protein n=1 Tax=Nocardioides luteus TaxID=1844 RepID=A0ABQ5T3H7_9ACTN|nr:hypothetical protein [Nocardioides luteus]MDR7309578.1 hypothetical protein [Nocardioides luteus]GGR52174.1 hypothetical protein GCM10010197_18000 [Nocardioides luteus]GLJ70639.1 hypothetical protein GCM10017579_46750 [Nocardioides luteus]